MYGKLAVVAAAVLAIAGPAIAQSNGNGSTRNVIRPPASGVYVGAYVDARHSQFSPGIENLESAVGRVLQLDVFNGVPLTEVTEGVLHNDGPMGRISVLTWGCGRQNATQIVDGGAMDPLIGRQAARVKALGYPVMIRLWREMNINWDRTGSNGNNCFTPGESLADAQREYRRVFQYVVTKFAQAGVTNVTWVWCPATGPKLSGAYGTPDVIQGFYPGDAYVDWTCIDAYDKPSPGVGYAGTFGPSNPGEYPAQIFKRFNKPLLIGEVGECNSRGADRCSGYTQTQSAFISAMQRDIQSGGAYFGLVKAVAWFLDDMPKHTYNWDFDEGGLAAFKSMVNAPFFNPNGCTAKSCPPPPTQQVH